MPSASQLRLTNTDIESMPEDGNRYEVIDGELFVSGPPTFTHQKVLTNTAMAVHGYLREHPIGVVVPGVGLIFDDYNAIIPDAVFATNERLHAALDEGRFHAAPEIVIEILSPGPANERRDRRVKLSLYAARGVGEYWIVDPENRSVELYRRDATGDLVCDQTQMQDDELASGFRPGFRVCVNTLFA
jgi:Uma2 family endonuclease